MEVGAHKRVDGHSIIRFLIIAIVFMVVVFLALIVSESVFGHEKKKDIGKLQADIETVNGFSSEVALFLGSYSDMLSSENSAQTMSDLKTHYNEIVTIFDSSPGVFSLTDGMALYSRVIMQIVSSLMEFFDSRLLGEELTEQDFEMMRLARLGFEFLYQASNNLSTEFIDCVSNRVASINRKYDEISRIQNTVLLVCIPLMLVWFSILYNDLIKGMRILSEGTDRLSRSEWDMPDLPMTSISEINSSINAINLMKKTIVDYIAAMEEHFKVTELLAEKTLETERQKRLIQETQFNLLQAQINPHFLFNTLNMVVNNVRAGEKLEETANVLVSTSMLLRSSIELKSPVISLKEEMRLLDNYITIQKARNEDRIEICMRILGGIPDVVIPPFSLQPLVENSILHGLKDKTENGYIEVCLFDDEEGGAMIQIHDNGVGMPEDVSKSAMDGTLSSNGLGNVVRRLKMVYSNRDIVDFSKMGEGSTIIIHLDASCRRTEQC